MGSASELGFGSPYLHGCDPDERALGFGIAKFRSALEVLLTYTHRNRHVVRCAVAPPDLSHALMTVRDRLIRLVASNPLMSTSKADRHIVEKLRQGGGRSRLDGSSSGRWTRDCATLVVPDSEALLVKVDRHPAPSGEAPDHLLIRRNGLAAPIARLAGARSSPDIDWAAARQTPLRQLLTTSVSVRSGPDPTQVSERSHSSSARKDHDAGERDPGVNTIGTATGDRL